MHCRLCKSNALSLVCTINTDELNALHMKVLGFRHAYRMRVVEALRCEHCQLIGYYGEPPAAESYYDALQSSAPYYEAHKPEFDSVATRIAPGSRILEVGAGAGYFAKYVPQADYTGLEPSRRAVGLAARADQHLIPASLEDHLLRHREEYDWVVSFQVLEHVDDIQQFVAACLDALKPGGIVVFSVPNDEAFVGAEQNNVLNYPPHHLTRWNTSSLRALAGQFGLQLVELITERLSESHLLSFAKVLVLSSLQRASEVSRLTPRPEWAGFPRRHVVSALARLLLPGLRLRRLQPPGHSITAMYRKVG